MGWVDFSSPALKPQTTGLSGRPSGRSTRSGRVGEVNVHEPDASHYAARPTPSSWALHVAVQASDSRHATGIETLLHFENPLLR